MLTNMIDYLRFALYAVLVFIVLMMYQTWNKEHPKAIIPSPSQTETTATNYVPDVSHLAPSARAENTAAPHATTPLVVTTTTAIRVSTDTMNVDIDPLGGNIIRVDLPQYPAELHSKTPFVLLNDSPDTKYIAQSGLLSAIGPDTSKGQAFFTSDQSNYALQTNQNNLQVKLNWQSASGIKVTKIFTFERNSYEVGVSYQIQNQSHTPWSGNFYSQLLRKNNPPKNTQGMMSLATYYGAAISSPDKPYEKISFKEMNNKNVDQTITGGWAAMIQHYFVSAWVPEKNITSQYFSRVTPDGLYTIGSIGPSINVNPGQTATVNAKFYAGPAIATQLESVAPGLQLTIDYGWLWLISATIFWMMQKIYNVIGNWGWSIVIVTLIIKLLFYHLSAKSYRSMSMLKKIQPRITAMKERFGDDKQKFTQATIELYKKEKINPMSGCLPILIQIPVFIGLYWVLIESVQLRQAPFILWIHDLSTKDPYYVLPVLMGIAMFLQQRLNPPPADPMQAKLMMFMPVVFTAMFLNFPAGLMLYWFVNNTLSFLQQWFIMRGLEKEEAIKKIK